MPALIGLTDKIRPSLWRCFLVAAICAVFTALPPTARSQTPGDDIGSLNEEQTHLANEMLRFVADMEAKHFAAIEELNGSTDIESKSFELDHANYLIKVARGGVIEKAGFTTSVTKKGIQPYTQDSIFSRVVTINIHPKTPLVGYLHMFASFQYNTDGRSSIGGWMGLAPAMRIEEDLAYIKERIDSVFEKYNADPTPYRSALCSGQRKANLGPACIGVSFYAVPFLDITERNYDLVTETFETLFDAYITVLKRRKDQDVTEQDLLAQDALRRRWLEDQMMYDPYAQNVIPHEVRSFANYPPTIKY